MEMCGYCGGDGICQMMGARVWLRGAAVGQANYRGEIFCRRSSLAMFGFLTALMAGESCGVDVSSRSQLMR